MYEVAKPTSVILTGELALHGGIVHHVFPVCSLRPLRDNTGLGKVVAGSTGATYFPPEPL